MATKSILKTITIKDKSASRSLINALEHADEKAAKEVSYSKSVRTADREQVQKMFGDNSK